jgi:tRNA(adenine34) deaminase
MDPEQQKKDEAFMRRALKLAVEAGERGEIPVGAVIVHDGRIIARASNQVEMLHDATAHAEMVAITQAEAGLQNWRLSDCTLYVTKEPCAMCAGAMINCRLGRLVYGCHDPRSGAAGSALDITGFPGMLHQVQVTRGLLEEECLAVLQEFFQRRRAEVKQKKGGAQNEPADGGQ